MMSLIQQLNRCSSSLDAASICARYIATGNRGLRSQVIGTSIICRSYNFLESLERQILRNIE